MTHPKFDLHSALQLNASEEWARVVLAALGQPGVTYAGNAEQDAHETVENFLRLYAFRLTRMRQGHFQAFGLEQLVTSLQQRLSSERVLVLPFRGPTVAVTAFVAGDCLLGCVTVEH